MVNLKAKPYSLSDEDIQWVENTIAGMTAEEKVGQLFFQLTAGMDEKYLRELMEKYHLGGCRYNNMPGQYVQMQNRILQKYAKVPVIIACNTENGGAGACSDGTYIAPGIKIGATGNVQYAHDLGRMANEEAASIGCNMAFAPVCDIHQNWENHEIIARAFGSDPARVAEMSKAYLDGAHTIPGFACAAKHFPGNGEDFRDAHMANNINSMNEEEWMATFGHVYKTLIDADLDAIMGGHIMMPNYMRQVKPGITDEEMMPATLCPEIMTGLLRDKLGFNGMVVTDASHMVAMTDRMPRKDMLPAAINAGCDMFLFFNDPEEDFATMLSAYQTGVISEERMAEALKRILGLKAHMGLNKKAKDELVPDAVTLVKYKDEGVLPLTPDKYKRIMIVHVKGAAGPMDLLMKLAMGGASAQKTPAEDLRDRLIEKGFDAFIYESPLEKIKQQIERGEKPSLNVYFAGKNAIEDFKSQQDLVITLFDVAAGRPSFGIAKGGGEIPWYVFELPVVGLSVNLPTMLADVPQLRTYINAYDSKPATMEAVVEKLLTGPEAFTARDPIDSFCGLWDAKI
ncbi:MAG: glycoside hydrolase family 3 N-terminal domain-containing protein [bacterium]|nr:glycoside hydrolase family 3 N-terminal domain-containing protein [bacterium]